jgi:hypothetical protein
MRKYKISKYQQGATVSVYNPTMNVLPQFTPLDSNIPMQIASMLKPIDVQPYFQAQNLFLARDKFEHDKYKFEEEKKLKQEDNSLRRIQLTKTFVDDFTKMEVNSQLQPEFDALKQELGMTPETVSKAFSDMEGLTTFSNNYGKFSSDSRTRRFLEVTKAVNALLSDQDKPEHLRMMSLDDQQKRLDDIQSLLQDAKDPNKPLDYTKYHISNYYDGDLKNLAKEKQSLEVESQKNAIELQKKQQELSQISIEKGQLDLDISKATKESKIAAEIAELELKLKANQVKSEQISVYEQYVDENVEPNMAAEERAEIHYKGRILSGIQELPAAAQGLYSPAEWIQLTPEERAAVQSQARSKNSTVTYNSIKNTDSRNTDRIFQNQNGSLVAVNPYMDSSEIAEIPKGSVLKFVKSDGTVVNVNDATYKKLFNKQLIKEIYTVDKDGIKTNESIFGEGGHPNKESARFFRIEDGSDGKQKLITNDPLVGSQFGLIPFAQIQEDPYNRASWFKSAKPGWRYVSEEGTGGLWEFDLGSVTSEHTQSLTQIQNGTSTNRSTPSGQISSAQNQSRPIPQGSSSLTTRVGSIFNRPDDSISNMSSGNIARIGSIPFDVRISSQIHHNNPEQTDITFKNGEGRQFQQFLYTPEGLDWAIITGTYVLHEVDPNGPEGLAEKQSRLVHSENDRIKIYGGCKSCTEGNKYTGTHLHLDKKPPTKNELNEVVDRFIQSGRLYEYSPDLTIRHENPRMEKYFNAVADTEERKTAQPNKGMYGGVGYFTIVPYYTQVEEIDMVTDYDMGKYQFNYKSHWQTIKKTYDLEHPLQFVLNPFLQDDYMLRHTENVSRIAQELLVKHAKITSFMNQEMAMYLVHNVGQRGANKFLEIAANPDDPERNNEWFKSRMSNLNRFKENLSNQQRTSSSAGQGQSSNAPKLNF